MEQIKALENLFDDCDERQSGKVSVSSLIMAMKNEVFKQDKDVNIPERHALLQSVHDLLDPLQQDLFIDKATWTNAWQGLDASPDGTLDQSKQSYCFSPRSRSSSLDSETDHSLSLQKEIESLRNNQKHLKKQLQTQEDALMQEQTERRELEINFASANNQIAKLAKQVKHLQETNEDLQSAIDSWERKKNNTVDQLHTTENKLRAELATRNNEITVLNKENEDLNQTVHILKSENDKLKTELLEVEKNHRAQIKEYQEAMQAHIHEMSAKITHSFFYKRDLAARLEECNLSGIDLQSELLELSDTASSFSVDMKGNTGLFLPDPESAASSTPRYVKPAVVSSLLEEMKALGSGISSSSVLDCSFDVPASSHQDASESDNSWSSGGDEKDLDGNDYLRLPVMGSVKNSKEIQAPPFQQCKNALQSNNNTSFVQNYADENRQTAAEEINAFIEDDPIKANFETNENYIFDKHGNAISLNLQKWTESCSVSTQTICCLMFEMESQTHLAVSEISIQATPLNRDAWTQMSPLIVSDLETQTSDLIVCVKETQTSHVTTSDVETQTTHNYSRIRNLSINAPVSEIGTQTLQENLMLDEDSSLEMLEDSLLAPPLTHIYQPNHRMNISSEKCSCGKGMSKGLASFNLFNNAVEQRTHERKEIGTQTIDEKTPSKHRSMMSHCLVDSVVKSSSKKQLEVPSCTHKWTQQDASSLNKWENSDLAKNFERSTVLEKDKLALSEMDLSKRRFKFWLAFISFLCLNVMVLICSTVILTAGVLETMAQSGLLSGASPRWMPQLSFLFKPFLRIDQTREPVV
ncbi:Inositol 1,4,5-triphosphate receptor associated 2 [Frankliniella fusca]|uniref:Inositol 1,4,5-triphosphate receptor associated 2 n=1 Tax=Frankliniella fusca TaxID=407009 RepID=A0AAE1HXB2_9NEOP|nr:Inositol 1,4,5-triphosphate receptor associated 2 [Frankliniella fusca]